MKHMLLGLLLITPFLFFGQTKTTEASTDRYIRIIGLAEKTIMADQMRVEFTLSEIKGNEYQKIYPKSIEDVKTEFQEMLKLNGIDILNIEEDKLKNITKSNYGKVATEYYFVVVKNEDEAFENGKNQPRWISCASSELYVFRGV